MPIQKLYRVQCGDCLRFLRGQSEPVHLKATVDPAATPLFTSYQDAVEAAKERGWVRDGLHPAGVCPDCVKGER